MSQEAVKLLVDHMEEAKVTQDLLASIMLQLVKKALAKFDQTKYSRKIERVDVWISANYHYSDVVLLANNKKTVRKFLPNVAISGTLPYMNIYKAKTSRHLREEARILKTFDSRDPESLSALCDYDLTFRNGGSTKLVPRCNPTGFHTINVTESHLGHSDQGNDTEAWLANLKAQLTHSEKILRTSDYHCARK